MARRTILGRFRSMAGLIVRACFADRSDLLLEQGEVYVSRELTSSRRVVVEVSIPLSSHYLRDLGCSYSARIE